MVELNKKREKKKERFERDIAFNTSILLLKQFSQPKYSTLFVFGLFYKLSSIAAEQWTKQRKKTKNIIGKIEMKERQRIVSDDWTW